MKTFLRNLREIILKLDDKKFKTYFISSIFLLLFLGAIIGAATYSYINNRYKNYYGSEELSEVYSKIDKLNLELGRLKLLNKNLKNAILLADSTLIKDSLDLKKKSKSHVFESFEYLVTNIYNYIIGNRKFKKPVDSNVLSRGFEKENNHFGIDYPLKINSPVYASASGYIIFSDYTVGTGYTIIVGHSDGYVTIYKHCSSLLKKERELVEQGELIALSGNSGTLTSGPHLHFEIWKNGAAIDPVYEIN